VKHCFIYGPKDEWTHNQGLIGIPGATETESHGSRGNTWIEVVLLRIADEPFKLTDTTQIER
jgi:hypothetical protein